MFNSIKHFVLLKVESLFKSVSEASITTDWKNNILRVERFLLKLRYSSLISPGLVAVDGFYFSILVFFSALRDDAEA